MLRILYVVDSLAIGGTEASILELATRLRRFDPVVCHIYRGDDLAERFEREGIPVCTLQVEQRYGFSRAVPRLRRLIRRIRPAVVHSSLFRSDLVSRLAAGSLRVPLVGSFVSDSYGPGRLGHLGLAQRTKLHGIRGLDMATARLVRHFISNSSAIKQSNCAALQIPPERVTVIYRGRDPERFRPPSEDERARVRTALGLNGRFVVLNVGRLVRAKAQCDLVRAVSLLRERIKEVVLLVAGEGPERGNLERQIRDLGLQDHVTLLGARADVPDLLRAADVFAFPSYYEGYPGALVEAMLSGLPIVSSDIPVHREAIRAGENGVICKVGDPADMAAKILALVDAPFTARLYAETARSDAVVRFGVDAFVRAHEDVYDSVAATSKK